MIGLKQEDDTYPANSVEGQLRVLEEALSESAGINRRGVGDERAPQRKSSELR